MNYPDKNFKGIVIIIYSCQKNVKKATLLYNFIKELSNDEIKIFIINGIEDLKQEYKFEDKFLYLKCKDNYDYLFLKTHKLFGTIINVFPNLHGVIKIDDDIFPNKICLNQILHFVKTNTMINYCGYLLSIKKQSYTSIHINKCNEKKYKKPIMLPVCNYCSGPLYYLSNKAIKYFNFKDLNYFHEDIMVGHSFSNSSIYPSSYLTFSNNKNFKWTTNIENVINKLNHGFYTFIKLHGGLGNQIFQVATGLLYSKKNNSLPILLYMDDSNEKNYYPHSDIRNILKSIFFRFNQLSIKDFDISYNSIKPEKKFIDAYKKMELKEIKNDNVLINGYFQNKLYFHEIYNELTDVLLNENVRNNLKNKIKNIRNLFFIHVRRGDYIGNNLYEIDYDNYYKNSINNVLKNVSLKVKTFYVLSNDIEYCKSYKVFEEFKDRVEFIYVEDLDEIESFYFMTLCKGGITCNSSYSWWGSYLNDTEDKKIIIPKIWMPNTNIDMSFENVITV